jgi:hypothetical protein
VGALVIKPHCVKEMTAVLYRYFIVVVACIALLIGLQIPNFVDQYQKRVNAHLREVTINLQPFQEIANKYFGGDIQKLIELHRTSTEKPLQEEGTAIEKMLARKLRFETDIAALNTNLPLKVLHVLFHGDREMLNEVISQYSYAVPLNQDALIFGACVALIFLFLLEMLLALARIAAKKLFQKPTLIQAE